MPLLFIYCTSETNTPIETGDSMLSEQREIVDSLVPSISKVEYHTLMLESAEASHDEESIIKSFAALGRDHKERCAYNESAAFYFRALALLEKRGDKYTNNLESAKSDILNGLGSLYLAMSQTDEALHYFTRSLEIAKRLKLENLIASNLIDIGIAHEAKGTYGEAYHYYNEALQYSIQQNSVSGMSRGFERMGHIYWLQGDTESALIYATSAYQSLLETSDKVNWLNACLTLANIHTELGNFKEAEQRLIEGKETAYLLDLPNYKEQVHLLFSNLYKVQGLSSKALEERILSNDYSRFFRNQENLNAILRHRLHYENEARKAEKERLIQQFDQKKKKIHFALVGNLFIIIALLGIIFLLIQNHRLRKRTSQAVVQLEMQKSMLCARVSQEFKNPVSIIIGLTERLKQELTLNEQSKHWVDLDILSRQSKNLHTLIDRVSSIANLQAMEGKNNVKNGNLIAYLQYLYECLASIIETKRITYTFHSNVSELLTSYDPEYLRIILHNLVDRAIKHCSENDHISINVKFNPINKNYGLSIFHTGQGILSDEMDLGITLAQHLVEKLDGRMETAIEPNKSTTYSLLFPLTVNHGTLADQPITIRKSALNPIYTVQHTNSGRSRSPLKPVVLIAQENRSFSYYLTTILNDKYDVFVESTGEGALKKANEVLPELIVSDTFLPRVNGFELCERVKESVAMGHIPIILITSTHTREERVRGFASGADACLERPLHEKELLAVIDQLLSSRKQIRETYSRITGIHQNRPTEINVSGDNLDFLERVTTLIYKEITNTDSLIETLSSEVCLSSSQLNRKIKAITGMTTSNYILRTRLNKAKKQLAISHKPIGEIAMECGFNDFAYFSRSFKREFGMTPTTFQRLHILAN